MAILKYLSLRQLHKLIENKSFLDETKNKLIIEVNKRELRKELLKQKKQ